MVKKVDPQESATDKVIKSGDAMIGIGAVLALIALFLGFAVAAQGGNGSLLGLVPVGVLLMIAGYCKKIAAVGSARLILAEEERADRLANR